MLSVSTMALLTSSVAGTLALAIAPATDDAQGLELAAVRAALDARAQDSVLNRATARAVDAVPHVFGALKTRTRVPLVAEKTATVV